MAKIGTMIALAKALGTPNDTQVNSAVSAWLAAHPEATTTVQDGAITRAKLDNDMKAAVDAAPETKNTVREYIHGVNETFTHTGPAGWDYFLCLLLEGVEYTIHNNSASNVMQARIYRADNSKIELGTVAANGDLSFVVPEDSDGFVRIGGYMNSGMSFTVTSTYSDFNAMKELSDEVSEVVSVSYTITKGKSIGVADGVEYSVSDYEDSDYIPVAPGEEYEITAVLGGSSVSNATGVAGYDSGKTFLYGLVSVYTVFGAWGSTRKLVENFRFKIPAGVYYMRGCSGYKGSGYPHSPLIIKKVNTSSSQYKVNTLQSEIENNGDGDMAGLVELSEYNTYVSGTDPNPTTKKANFTLSVCSDVHGAGKQWDYFVAKGNKHKNLIDCAVNLGDISAANPRSDIPFYIPSDSEIPLLTVIGNHDVAQNGGYGINTSEVFTRYIQPIVSAGFVTTENPYYYKDFADYKVRVIALYEYEGAATTSSATSDNFYRYMTSEQLQWFADTLYSTPSDYSVVVLLHQVVYYNPVIVDNPFTEKQVYRRVNNAFNGGLGYLFNKMSGDCIGDIVNAFQTGASISESYTATIGGSTVTSIVSKDFTDRGTGKFLCYLGGHSHAPFVLRNGTYNNQLQILIPSASDSAYQRHNDDIRAVENVPNFYFVAFDTINKIVKVYKAGYQVTQGMDKRDYMAISCEAN